MLLDLLIFVLFTVLVVGGIGYGFFILFRKKKVPENIQPKFFSKLSEEAKAVHRREMNLQLPRIYSLQWFKEYWQGKRSLFYSVFAINFTLVLPIFVIVRCLNFLYPTSLALLLVFVLLLLPIIIFHWVSVWRCANNSTPFFKYFGKCLVILWCVDLAFRVF